MCDFEYDGELTRSCPVVLHAVATTVEGKGCAENTLPLKIHERLPGYIKPSILLPSM